MGDRMPAKMLRMIAIVAVFSSGAFAVAGEQPRYAPMSIQKSPSSSRSTATLKAPRAPSLKQNATRTLAVDRDPYADPAAPYKANRLSPPQAASILDVPGQTTVLTRQVLDDMNATSLRGALRSTAGVTVGR
jgi:outer membrane receptor for monomeric catechols